ncbi:MAG: hypothetical protein E5X74_04710 [Mesorhizobium sp.]|nr:MAG: hypothetical protein E5X75_16440 [Mesorhizobium sp.]TIO87246.1 MAG: hypothetical protein E5X74_04710 [Mesorhizobium sp.]
MQSDRRGCRRSDRRPPIVGTPCSAIQADFRAIPGKVRGGFPSGIASEQRDRAVLRFRETMNRSKARCREGRSILFPEAVIGAVDFGIRARRYRNRQGKAQAPAMSF